MIDTFDAVTSCAPTPESIGAEWTAARQDAVLAAILGDVPGQHTSRVEIPIQPRPTPTRHGRRRVHAVGVSVAALTAAAAAIAALILSGGSGRPDSAPGSGPVIDPPPGLSEQALPAGKYSYRVVEQIELDEHGKPVPGAADAMTDRSYLDAAGNIISFRAGSQHGCFRFPNQSPDLSEPSVAVLAKLPTDVHALGRFLRAHVDGSSSRDEAVFVAVADALRTADGLASPKLRAALLAVLSRTPGVQIHRGQRDYLGRPAIRADFVDQQIRPGEVHALYFDPVSFQLLEEGTWSNGQPSTYNGPSPAYTAHPPAGVDPDQLPPAGFVTVMTTERVINALPAIPPTCR